MQLWIRTRKKRKKKPGEALRVVAGVMPWARSRRRARVLNAVSWLSVFALAATLISAAVPAKEKKVPRTVTGRVLNKDEDGIVGATVELTDLQTSKKVAIYSEADGRYQFSDLQPLHDYQIKATYNGDSSEVRKVSSFDSRTHFVINLYVPPVENNQK